MAFANNTIEQLDKKMCDAVNVNHDDYKKMDLMEKGKVRAKYMKVVHNKKQINHK